MAPKRVALVIGSTRGLRVGPDVVAFVQRVFAESHLEGAPEFHVVDIMDFHLPVFNERVVPATVPLYAQFEHEHSKAWSQAIAAYDGYIIITPEYNNGIPGGLKNALDYLWHEISLKPAMIVSYGVSGGCWASDALKRVLECMKMRVVETRPMLTLVGAGSGVISLETVNGWEEQRGILVRGLGELILALGSE